MLFMGRDQTLIMRVNGHGFARIRDVAGWMGVDYFTAARRIGKWAKAGLVRKRHPPFATIVAIVPTVAGCEWPEMTRRQYAGFDGNVYS